MGFPWTQKCCCDTCIDCEVCPPDDAVVYVVLTGTSNDGSYLAVWDDINSAWFIDFGVCTTLLYCAISEGKTYWSLFLDQSCPIGGSCSEEQEDSPLVLVPAIDCDNCGMDLLSGSISIYWHCDGSDPLPMMASAEPVEEPSLLAKAASLTSSATEWLLGGLPLRKKEERDAIMEICNTCPQRDGNRCRACGCNLPAKIAMATSSCPIGLWKAREAE